MVKLFWTILLWLGQALSRNGELGGFVHDTAMSQYIPPTLFHCATGTWTWVAGTVTDTIAKHKAAGDETAIINIPIIIPSNSVAGKGALLKSIEVDYKITTDSPTSITPLVNLITRGIEGAVATVAAQAFTQSPTLAASKTVEKHKLVITITTPFWIDNDQFVLLELTLVSANGAVWDILAAVANFTLRA